MSSHIRNLVRKRPLAALTVALVLGAGLAIADTKPAMKKLTSGPFTLKATPIANFGRAGQPAGTGKLEWRGGLLLQSEHRNFGGWSGLAIERDGRRFLAVSDAGAWMTGELTYAGKAPTGIANTRIGPLLTRDGQNLTRGRDRDAESLTLLSGSLDKANLLVAFEQNTRIARYDFSISKGSSPTRGFVELPQAARISARSGFEAMTVLRGGPHTGAFVAFSERGTDAQGHRSGWLWGNSKPGTPVRLTDKGGYAVTDVASLEDGSLIVLERRFGWFEGLFIRLRVVAAKDVASGEPIAGETLLEADLAHEIDNMEGLAISRDASGTAILTLISDDNFNTALQRTLLLQFAYPGDPAKALATRPITAKTRP
jgi:hypothetical protein